MAKLTSKSSINNVNTNNYRKINPMEMMMKKNLNEDERSFVISYTKKMLLLMVLGIGLFAGVLLAAYAGPLDITPKGVPLNSIEDRLVYTLKHISIQLAWIIAMIYFVILQRIGTPALDPSNGYEQLVQNAKNILTNNIEHGLVFILSQMIMSIDLEPELCGRLIPILNLLYVFGRVLYLIGYPSNRTFGFVICNFSILLTVAHNMFYLIKLHFDV